jgi:hypothetical protein
METTKHKTVLTSAASVAHVAASGHNATDHVIVDANFQLMNKWGVVTTNSKFREH